MGESVVSGLTLGASMHLRNKCRSDVIICAAGHFPGRLAFSTFKAGLSVSTAERIEISTQVHSSMGSEKLGQQLIPLSTLS